MGLLSEGINEVIATTRLNAAPMGIINRNNKLLMNLYRGSHTAANVEADGWIVANFTYDPILWVRTAFEDLEPNAFVDMTINGKTMCHLHDAEAWAAFDATIQKKSRESIVVSLTPLKEEISNLRLHPVNRGFNNLIEAAVHVTRYVRFKDQYLLDLINHHGTLVRRCGGLPEQRALDMLMEYLEKNTKKID